MEKDKKSMYLITGSFVAFVVVILVALFVPSPLNFNNDDKDMQKVKSITIEPEEIIDNDQAVLYLVENEEEKNDFLIHFNVASNDEFYDYMNFFDEYNYEYTLNGITPYIDDYIVEEIKDLQLNRNFTTENWRQEIKEYTDTLREVYTRYVSENNLDYDLDYFNKLKIKQINISTINQAIYNFILSNPDVGFSFYKEDIEFEPIVFYYK